MELNLALDSITIKTFVGSKLFMTYAINLTMEDDVYTGNEICHNLKVFKVHK